MARSSNTDFTGNIGDFISFAEDRINYGSEDPEFPSPPLRVAEMEIAATALTVLASSNTVALPGDFLEMRRIYITGNPNQKLTYVTPNQIDSALASAPPGPQAFYTIQGNSVYMPSPVQTTQTLVIGYYQKVPPLSSSNTVNWLVATHPSMYLAGAMLEGSLFLGDDEGAAKWARIFTGHTRAFRRQDVKSRYSGDAMQMKTDTGNP